MSSWGRWTYVGRTSLNPIPSLTEGPLSSSKWERPKDVNLNRHSICLGWSGHLRPSFVPSNRREQKTEKGLKRLSPSSIFYLFRRLIVEGIVIKSTILSWGLWTPFRISSRCRDSPPNPIRSQWLRVLEVLVEGEIIRNDTYLLEIS